MSKKNRLPVTGRLSRIAGISMIYVIISQACDQKKVPLTADYSHGILITNEGAFNHNNGTLSFYNPSGNMLTNDIFYASNHRALGDIVQSFTEMNGKGFIVVNNSEKIEVVKTSDFSSIGTMQASYPRFLIPVDSARAYLTNGSFPGQVLVVNTLALAITDTIWVGNQPEHLLKVGNNVLVANGKWGNDSTISVIDAGTDQLLENVYIGDGPSNLVEGKDHSVWVLCEGINQYSGKPETNSSLVKIDAGTYNILSATVVGQMGDGYNPYLLARDNNGNIYYVEADGVHKVEQPSSSINDQLLINWHNSSESIIYGLAVDQQTGNLYVLEAKGFASAGMLHVYDPSGSELRSFEVGIAPNGAVAY